MPYCFGSLSLLLFISDLTICSSTKDERAPPSYTLQVGAKDNASRQSALRGEVVDHDEQRHDSVTRTDIDGLIVVSANLSECKAVVVQIRVAVHAVVLAAQPNVVENIGRFLAGKCP